MLAARKDTHRWKKKCLERANAAYVENGVACRETKSEIVGATSGRRKGGVKELSPQI
jgi:hypothetical protein